MIEPVPGRLAVDVDASTAGYAGRRIWGTKTLTQTEAVIFRGGGLYEMRSVLGTTSSTPTIADSTLLGEPCGLFEARDRAFMSGPRGALVFDTTFTAARMLGMLQPTWLGYVSATTTNAQAVPASSRVAYRATLHRKDSDGYEIISAPSYAAWLESGGAITDFTMRIGWWTSARTVTSVFAPETS